MGPRGGAREQFEEQRSVVDAHYGPKRNVRVHRAHSGPSYSTAGRARDIFDSRRTNVFSRAAVGRRGICCRGYGGGYEYRVDEDDSKMISMNMLTYQYSI